MNKFKAGDKVVYRYKSSKKYGKIATITKTFGVSFNRIVIDSNNVSLPESAYISLLEFRKKKIESLYK